MSFYNVENPQRIIQSDPSYRVTKNISFLQSGFQQPDGNNSNSTVDDSKLVLGTLTYSAENLINRYIERTGNAGIPTLESTPSAFEIIYTLNQNQAIHQDAYGFVPTSVRKGFYFDFCIYNETDHLISLVPGVGVRFGGFVATGPVVNPEAIGQFRAIVTNPTPSTGPAEVYISELSCCSSDSYPPIIPP